MEKTLPLYLGPSVIGSVICRITEHGISLSAKTYASLSGIYRAYIRSFNGTLLIGVLAPEEHFFSANKLISENALLREGLTFDDITYAFAICNEKENPAPMRWQEIKALPDILCKDKIISTLAHSSGALADHKETPSKIAIPIFTGKPFPCPDVLCLLTPQNINGTLYGIIGISEKGAPQKA